MKKSTLIVLFSYSEEDPVKAYKKAQAALGAYTLDSAHNPTKLDEAKALIDIASADSTMAGLFKTHKLKGDIYLEISDRYFTACLLEPNTEITNPQASLTAVKSYKKALDLAKKKYERKDAVPGLSASCKHAQAMSHIFYEKKEYALAYEAIILPLEMHNPILENGGEIVFSSFEEFSSSKYQAVLLAIEIGKIAEAKVLINELFDSEYRSPDLYITHFKLLNTENKAEEALKVLEEAKAKYPDSFKLFSVEMKYYFQKRGYDVMQTKIQDKINKDPDNYLVYSFAGTFYSDLYEEELKTKGMTDAANKYFSEAEKGLEKATELNPSAIDALYTFATLYHTKALKLIEVQGAINPEVESILRDTLTYLKKVEKINPNDLGTLIMLADIFTKLQDTEKAAEFNKRVALVQSGGTCDGSYFE